MRKLRLPFSVSGVFRQFWASEQQCDATARTNRCGRGSEGRATPLALNAYKVQVLETALRRTILAVANADMKM